VRAGLDIERVTLVLQDLEEDGYVRRDHRGDTTFTTIDRGRTLRGDLEHAHPVGRLIDAVESPADVLRERLGVSG